MLRLLKSIQFQVNRNFCASKTTENVVENLKSRSLIKVHGKEAQLFLQGLVTNDMRHLESDAGSMYAMFLNIKGRVLYDAIIYRPLEPHTYLIDCDMEGADTLQNHMKMFNLRKKVTVTCIDDEYSVWASYNPDFYEEEDGKNVGNVDRSLKTLDGKIVPCTSINKLVPKNSLATKKIDGKNDMLVFRDPRMINLGARILAPINCSKLVTELFGPPSEKSYRWHRYKLGVGEGVKDIPPGNSFPLESNCDYLHGVSFHKGCYLGQELTARSHHTGVIRKRLMPLHFTKIPTNLNVPETIKMDDINLGKFRGIEKDKGLALLRIDKALDLEEIKIGDGIAQVSKPTWWPSVAPKEKANIENKTN